METKKILSATLVGTTAMTLFSYLLSLKVKKNFTEPELLHEIAQENLPDVDDDIVKPASWATHYGVGLAFTGAYSQVWEHTSIKPSIASGAVLGALSGAAGIMGWSQAFKLEQHPHSSKFRKQYYTQLMAAHIVFGIGAAIGYKMLSKNKKLIS